MAGNDALARENPRLAASSSPYLRAAARQPVDWYPWGREAFERAQREDKPILLDVGAAWCHWCHVMDHESYEDPEIARVINDLFVPVKVDRDERPDVDARYQKLVSLMSRQGGWPLTGFLAPDGRVFYGGTYFPRRGAGGRPGFRNVLEGVAQAYRENRDHVYEQIEHMQQILAQYDARTREAGPAFSAQGVDAAARRLEETHDPDHGGWGKAPKFPHPSGLELLLTRLEDEPADASARRQVTAALDGMRRGGIHDRVAGGFHRYATDAAWTIPHFEKMLQDNAELLRNHVQAVRALGRGEDASVAHGIVRFIDETLADPEGGFRASQDADVGVEDDGAHYTWTEPEVHRAVCDAALAKLVLQCLGAGTRGRMPHDPERFVLHEEADLEDVAKAQGRTVEDVARDLERGLERLRKGRAGRPAPFVDPVAYTNWNAMAVRAYYEYAAALGRPEAAAFARRTLDRFLADAWDPKRGFRHALGASRVEGLLDDHAQMLPALVAAYSHDQRPEFLEVARRVADILLDEFWDADEGAFRDTARTLHPADGAGPLAEPDYPTHDSPGPSANARALEGLLLLSDLVEDGDRFRRVVEQALTKLWPRVDPLGLFAAHMFLVAHRFHRPAPRVVVAGPPGDGVVEALHRAALLAGPGGTRVVRINGTGTSATVPEEARAFAQGPARERAGALVCVGTRCLPPVHDAAELRKVLRGAPHEA